MGELETQYTDKVNFTIVPAEETLAATDKIAEYGFTEARHGLVALSSAGEAVVKMPGHSFGKDEIEATIGKLLASNKSE